MLNGRKKGEKKRENRKIKYIARIKILQNSQFYKTKKRKDI